VSRAPAGLVLAAGAGTRMGGPKAVLELEDELLVERAERTLREGGCEPVVVVLGADAMHVRSRAALADVVVCTGWQEGMGASLRAGLQALEDRSLPACVVALVDQPDITAAAVQRLVRAWEQGAEAAVATYAGAPRNPVLLGSATWAGVASLSVGDVGARAWLRAHPERVVQVPCDDVASHLDLDTQADLEQRRAQTRHP